MNYTTNNPEVISVDYYDFLQKSIKKLTKSKKHVSDVIDSWDDKQQNPLTPMASSRVFNCGSWLKFRHYEDINKKTLYKARFCKKDKICPACSARRASKQVSKVHNQLTSNPELLKANWYYIVLPVHHNSSEDFMTVFDRLQNGLKSINQSIRNVARGQNSNNFFSQFDGIMYSIEETKTQNGWNIHANLLVRTKSPLIGLIKKKGYNSFWNREAVETWKEIADGSQNISISPINVSNSEVLIKNLQEVFKYSLKFQELSPDDLLIAYNCLFRKRLLGTMGTLRGLSVDVDLQGDEVENEIFIETLYHYTKKYILSSHRRGKVYKDGYSIYEDDYFEE